MGNAVTYCRAEEASVKLLWMFKVYSELSIRKLELGESRSLLPLLDISAGLFLLLSLDNTRAMAAREGFCSL